MAHPRPNILFVLVDCLRADRAAGRTGGARIPALAALTDRAVRFDKVRSSASLTTPSVASLFTGLFPLRHGVRSLRGFRLREDVPTLAEALSAAGYTTRAEVSGPLLDVTGLSRGFATWRCREEGENVYSRFGPFVLRLVRSGLRAPWFLFLHLWELHRPRKVLRRFDSKEAGDSAYDRALSSLDTFLGKLFAATGERSLVILTGDHGEAIRTTDSDPRFWRRVSRIRAIEPWLDRRKRRMRDRDRRPLPPGEGPCHGFAVKEELVRVPLLLAGGSLPPPRTILAPVRHVDVPLTLLDLLGLPPLPETDGRSLLTLLAGGRLTEEPAWSEATGRARPERTDWLAGIRIGEIEYIRPLYGDAAREEIYDLVEDPEEKENLVTSRPDLLARMRTEFDRIAAREAHSPDSDLDPEQARLLNDRLRRLGYLGGDG